MTRTVRCPLSGKYCSRILLVVICSVTLTLSASKLSAITWEFTDEESATASPWTAWQGTFQQGEEIYDTRMEGGSWIIDIPKLWVSGREFTERVTPSLEILSPIIGHDTALFDQVRVRARFVTDTPFAVGARLAWNEHLWEPGRVTQMFLDNPVVADGSWQEFAFDLRIADAGSWSGELRGFHVAFRFSGGNVRSVEVDWIILTGFEEQLKGELSPPPLEAGVPPGQLLEEARFTSLGRIGVGTSGGLPGQPVAVLEDLDGDGALDLASAWYTFGWSGGAGSVVDKYGWLAAMGDGVGGFRNPWVSEGHVRSISLLSGDTDGSGAAEVVWTSYLHTEILRNRSGTWEVAGGLEEGVVPLRLADGDGDGDLDLLAADWARQGGLPFFGLMFNDGEGRFEGRMDLSPKGGTLIQGVANACGEGRLGALWAKGSNLDRPEQYLVTCLDEDGQVVKMPVHSRISDRQLRFAGDLDGDHDIDLLANAELLWGPDDLLIVTNTGDGTMVEETLVEGVQVRSVWVGDLDLDGRLDILFVDARIRSPALVVYTGGEGGHFALEGRYPLAGLGSEVLVGDLNGDACPDVVVLVPSAKGTGGAHTFLNRGADSEATSVALGDLGPKPGEPSIVSVYPNPFNSNVMIRLTKAGLHEDHVSMGVYNVAGQRVRSLARGALAAGTYEVLWDGRTDQGEPVSSGVYLLRVEFGGRSLVQKMLVAR